MNKKLILVLFLNIFFINYINASYNENINSFKFNNYDIPSYNGKPCQIVNNNIPKFSYLDITKPIFEKYSELDVLNRSGVAFSKVNYSLMPTKKSKSINSIISSGWKQKNYSIIPGTWLYNRTHLIAYQLTGEDVNEKNIITGTYYLNHDGMLPYENMIASYLKQSNKKMFLYRVTPVFQNNNLVASGVIMEGLSFDFSSIIFNVFCYNVQPGISINYSNGESKISKIDKEKIINTKKYKQSLYIKCNELNNVKYQYAYKKSSNKKFNYKYSNLSTIKIKNLKENTNYDIKVRAYRKIYEKKIYGSWSNIIKVKTLKN